MKSYGFMRTTFSAAFAVAIPILFANCAAASDARETGATTALLALRNNQAGDLPALSAIAYSGGTMIDLQGIPLPSHNQSLTFNGTWFYSAYVEVSDADRAIVYAHSPSGYKLGSAFIPGWEHVGGSIYDQGWNYTPVTMNDSSRSGFVRYKWDAAAGRMLVDDLGVSFPNIRLGMATAVINASASTPGQPKITAFRLYSFSSRQFYQCTIQNAATTNATASCGTLQSPAHNFQIGDPMRQASAPFYAGGQWKQVVTPFPAYGPVDSRDMKVFAANDDTVQTGNNELDAWTFSGSHAPEGIWVYGGRIYLAGHESGTLTSPCGVKYPCTFAYGTEYRQRVMVYNQ